MYTAGGGGRAGGGGQRVFLGNLKLFGKGQGELTKIFHRGWEGGGANFFSTYEKRKHYFVDFFLIKEDHPNCSMLEALLLAHLLYKYTPYRNFIINIKAKCFYCKATTKFQ